MRRVPLYPHLRAAALATVDGPLPRGEAASDALTTSDTSVSGSVTGASWNPIAVPSINETDPDFDHVVELPATLSGTVLIRVIDTDRTPGNDGVDTISVDQQFIRSVTAN